MQTEDITIDLGGSKPTAKQSFKRNYRNWRILRSVHKSPIYLAKLAEKRKQDNLMYSI